MGQSLVPCILLTVVVEVGTIRRLLKNFQQLLRALTDFCGSFRTSLAEMLTTKKRTKPGNFMLVFSGCARTPSSNLSKISHLVSIPWQPFPTVNENGDFTQ